MRRVSILMTALFVFLAVFATSASAVERGNSKSKTNGKLTIAETVSMLVDEFDLNIDHIRFIKEPKASDYFTKVKDEAEYAGDFIIAHLNGLPIAKDVDPEQRISKELFAHLLYNAVETTGDYALIKMLIQIKDSEAINPEYFNSIHSLLLMDIMELNSSHKFQPKNHVQRFYANNVIKKALEFVKSHQGDKEPNMDSDVLMTVEKESEAVNKVTLSWGTKPNSGYRITIDKIEFNNSDMTANVHYTLHKPDPDKVYLMVIVEPRAVTYIPASYTPVPVELNTQSKSEIKLEKR